jgi:large subunit ribosomal protein L6
MSRIGKKEITVPAGVKVAVKDRVVMVEGPKGKLQYAFRPEIQVTWAESEKAIRVSLASGVDPDDRFARAMWGTTRAHLRNMIEGVTKGYEKSLQVVGTGWNATLAGKQLKLLLGYANSITLTVPDGVTVVVDKPVGDTTPIKVSGISRDAVGQFAAAIRQQRPPEPYNGKGVKYFEETIKRKQGKQFGA